MEERIIIDTLTQDSVSIKKQKITIINEVEYTIGEPRRKAYINSIKGRQEIKTELEAKYVNAILSVWGGTPTIEDNPTE